MRKKYEQVLTMTDGRKRMPYFLGFIAETKDYKNTDRKDYQKYNTSMDYLHDCVNGKRARKSKGSQFMPLADIFKPNDYDWNLVNRRHVNRIIQLANDTDKYIKFVSWSSLPPEDKKCFIQRAKDNLLFDINRLKINEHTMYRVLWNMDKDKDPSIKHMLFFVLFNYKNDILTNVLKQYEKVNTFLSEDNDGEIMIYGRKFSKKKVKNLQK